MATIGFNHESNSTRPCPPTPTSLITTATPTGEGGAAGSDTIPCSTRSIINISERPGWKGTAPSTGANTSGGLAANSTENLAPVLTVDALRRRADQVGTDVNPRAASHGGVGSAGRVTEQSAAGGSLSGERIRQGDLLEGMPGTIIAPARTAGDERSADAGDEGEKKLRLLPSSSGNRKDAVPVKRPETSVMDVVAEVILSPLGDRGERCGGDNVDQQPREAVVSLQTQLDELRQKSTPEEPSAPIAQRVIIPKQAPGMPTQVHSSMKTIAPVRASDGSVPAEKSPRGRARPKVSGDTSSVTNPLVCYTSSSRPPETPTPPRASGTRGNPPLQTTTVAAPASFAANGGATAIDSRAAAAAATETSLAMNGGAAASASPAGVAASTAPTAAAKAVIRSAIARPDGGSGVILPASNPQKTIALDQRVQPSSAEAGTSRSQPPLPPSQQKSATAAKLPSSSPAKGEGDDESKRSVDVSSPSPTNGVSTSAQKKSSETQPDSAHVSAVIETVSPPAALASSAPSASTTETTRPAVLSPSSPAPTLPQPSPAAQRVSTTTLARPQTTTAPAVDPATTRTPQRQQQRRRVETRDSNGGSKDKASRDDADGGAVGGSRKRGKTCDARTEIIRPVAAPVIEPALQIPEVSKADVGKMVLSETRAGTLTGIVEFFSERNGLGVWRIRYENGRMEELDDCGELHDDMCAYFEFAGNAAAAPGKQVRTRSKPSVQEQVRARLFEDGRSVVGRRVCKIIDKSPCGGKVTEYIQPTRDGEIDRWRVTYDDGETADLESFELVRPLLRYVERRIEQREVHWGFRKLSAYLHRTGDSAARPYATLAGISASMPSSV